MRILLFVFLVSLFSISAQARGNPFLDQLFKKQSTKSKSRFTLSDWLLQKKSFKAQDHWLAINTSQNLFEMSLSGGVAELERVQNTGLPDELDMNRYQAAFYLTIFGIEGNVESVADDFKSQAQQLNVRLLGAAAQGTNLTGFYGTRNWQDDLTDFEVDNNYWGGGLALYLMPFIGIEGKYTKFLKDVSSTDVDVEGYREEYGAFLEFNLIRIFGTYFKDIQERTTAGVTDKFVRDGVYTGLSLFF